MKNAKFWVDFALEAGDANVCHRYWLEIELEDEAYEELYQVWFDNGSRLNSWDSKWTRHDELFDRINVTAYKVLNKLLKENEPEYSNPLDVYWEISKETEDEF